MGLLQKIYDAIKGYKTPGWLKALLQAIQDVLVRIAIQVGQEYINQIRQKIIEVGMDDDLKPEEKFKVVFQFSKSLGLGLKDSYLNLLIESLVTSLKEKRLI